MLITLSRRAVTCQSVVEVRWTGVASLGAASHRFKFLYSRWNDVQGILFNVAVVLTISASAGLSPPLKHNSTQITSLNTRLGLVETTFYKISRLERNADVLLNA